MWDAIGFVGRGMVWWAQWDLLGENDTRIYMVVANRWLTYSSATAVLKHPVTGGRQQTKPIFDQFDRVDSPLAGEVVSPNW